MIYILYKKPHYWWQQDYWEKCYNANKGERLDKALWLLVITSFLAKQRFNICLCSEKQIIIIIIITMIIITIIIIVIIIKTIIVIIINIKY